MVAGPHYFYTGAFGGINSGDGRIGPGTLYIYPVLIKFSIRSSRKCVGRSGAEIPEKLIIEL